MKKIRDPNFQQPARDLPQAFSKLGVVATSDARSCSNKVLCEKVIIKHFGLRQTIARVAEDRGVSNNFCRSVISLWEDGRRFWKQGKDRDRDFRKFDPDTLGVQRSLVEQAQTLYLHEIQEQLQLKTGKSFSLATLCRGLREAGYTRKKVTGSWNCP